MAKIDGTRVTARHEAAHAVTAVRLGLPLVRVDIKRRPAVERNPGERVVAVTSLGASEGLTELGPEVSFKAVAGVPVTGAELAMCERLAPQAAAGIVADRSEQSVLEGNGDVGAFGDLVVIGQTYAVTNGLIVRNLSTKDPGFAQFVQQSINKAREVLLQDGGAAWDRVTATLLRKKSLSGDEVRALVTESDARGT